MSLLVKPGVRLSGVRPEMFFAATVVDQVYEAFGQHQCVITSAIDSKHELDSDHYRGEAFDFRTQDPGGAWAFDDSMRAKVRGEIQSRLGEDYVVIDEGGDAANSTGPHIHVSWRPKQPLSN